MSDTHVCGDLAHRVIGFRPNELFVDAAIDRS
jgi:hypothetical protein